METSWHIERDRNKHGPYTSAQMQQMAVAGNLLPTDMVLQEGTTTWRPASEVDGFFPALKVAQPPPIPVAEAAEWHFSQDGSQSGPVTMSHLKGMAENGHLHPADLVWKAGMSGWVAGSSVQEIFPPAKMPPPLPKTASQPSMPAATGPIAVAPTSEKEDPEEHFNRGAECLRQDKYDRAITHLTKAIQIDPNYAEAYTKRCRCYNEMGDYDKAIADQTEVIRLVPNNGSHYHLRAVYHSNAGHFDLAIADCKEAIRLEPSFNTLTASLARYYAIRGNDFNRKEEWDHAVNDHTEAIRLNPTSQWYHNRGVNLYNKGDYSAALVDAEKAVQLDPGDNTFEEFAKLVRNKLGVAARPVSAPPTKTSPVPTTLKPSAAPKPPASPAPKPAAAPAPSASWTPGLYYLTNGSWHPGPKTEEEFTKLIKSKSITLDTLKVIVPENMTPVRICESFTAEEIEAFHRLVNKPTGFWSALKAKGFLGASANILGALDGKWTCGYCREKVRYGATICSHCRSEIEY